jgi:hypothetical protein
VDDRRVLFADAVFECVFNESRKRKLVFCKTV